MHRETAALPGRVGHYDIFHDQHLGQGTYGAVCRGKNINDGTEVAIKRVTIPRRSEDLKKYIDGELETLRSITHSNIVTFLYHQKVDTHTFFILELCDSDLQYFAQENADFEAQKMQVVEDVACAVNWLHDGDVIHRDIKPENILMKDCSGRWVAKLTDLGLSRRVPGDSRSFSLTGGLGIELLDFLLQHHSLTLIHRIQGLIFCI